MLRPGGKVEGTDGAAPPAPTSRGRGKGREGKKSPVMANFQLKDGPNAPSVQVLIPLALTQGLALTLILALAPAPTLTLTLTWSKPTLNPNPKQDRFRPGP